jgi:hypothetical protein
MPDEGPDERSAVADCDRSRVLKGTGNTEMADFEIWKAIFEVRYPAAGPLFDNRGRIANTWRWEFGFTDWRIARNEVTVYEESGASRFQVGHQRCGLVVELPTRYVDFSRQAVTLVSHTLELLEVRKLERIGLRLIQLAERKHFRLLVTRMREGLYRLDEEDWEPLGGHPTDVGFPLTLRIGDRNANFMMGPMEKMQLAKYFESDRTKEQLPEAALFVDFDFYEEEPSIHPKDLKKGLAGFLELGENEALRRPVEFVEGLGGFET